MYYPLHERLNMAACLSDARLDDRALVAQLLFGAVERLGQLTQIAAAAVGEFDALLACPFEPLADDALRDPEGGDVLLFPALLL